MNTERALTALAPFGLLILKTLKHVLTDCTLLKIRNNTTMFLMKTPLIKKLPGFAILKK